MGIDEVDTSLVQEKDHDMSHFDNNVPPQFSGLKGTIFWCGLEYTISI